jgi:hypothetical protein
LLLSGITSCSPPSMADEQPTEADRPVPPRQAGSGRRRGHRGGRGRSQRRTEQISPAGLSAAAPVSPTPKAAAVPSAIGRAIEEVTQIVELLKQTLDQMEEVLELVELAERQKRADEREIESLRRALRRIHQPQIGPQASPKRTG